MWKAPGRSLVHALAALVAACAIAAGCRRPPTISQDAGLRPGLMRGSNVLLVTIDTLRRDRLGAYGSARGLTPTLDRLASEGVSYTQAFSHVPLTLPAHASILTGLTPPHHGIHDNVSFRLDPRLPTIATELKRAGYRTGAFVGAFVLDGRFGLNQGFDVYDDRLPRATAINFEFSRRRADEVLAAAADWILAGQQGRSQKAEGPFFAWVHLYDPHAPYEAPPQFRTAGRQPYDAAVAYTDASLGRFLDRLRAAHALDRTLIVVTADHGESLGEHGETTHGLFAYDATIAVPLILWADPGGGTGPPIRPARVSAPVAHVDILPTILELTGVAIPPRLDGRSLVAAPPAERVVRFEALEANLTRGWAPLTGIVEGGWKYIDLPIPELYDLDRDPAELSNVARREAPRFDVMVRLFRDTAPGSALFAAPAPPIDPAAAARLQSLGYVGGRTGGRPRAYTENDDPKRLIGLSEEFANALEAFNEGQGARALDGFARVLRARPDFVAARTSAATILIAQHRPADAAALLRDAPADQQRSPELLAKLGQALAEAGDPRGAIAAFEEARRGGDANPELLNSLGVAYASAGREADARSLFEALLRADPGAAGTWYNLARLEAQGHHQAAAADALRRAVAADPSYAAAWTALGGMLVNTDRGAAIDAWTRAERLTPGDYDLLYNLGMVLAQSGRGADALPYLQRFAREAPRDRYGADVARVERVIASLAGTRR